MMFVYTTCSNLEEAQKLAHTIIEKKMGACVDYWPVNSTYRWNGEIKNISQVMLLITTLEHKIELINELIPDHTAYSTPIIAGVNIDRMSRSYKEWMIQQVV